MKESRNRRKMNAFVSLCICAAMLFTFTFVPEMKAYAASEKTEYSSTSTKGAYYIAGHGVGTDVRDTFVYDDELLKGDSKTYNRSLATMTYELAEASMSSDREPKTAAGYTNKSRNTRYADDCVIVVGSRASATRVMYSITDWIERKLGLKVNATKSKITKPSNLKYLGFGFYKNRTTKEWRARPHQDSIAKFKRKLKKLCRRNMSIDMTTRIKRLNWLIRGWINYFAIADMKTKMAEIDGPLRVMMRVIIWKQWKVQKKREWGLKKLGVAPWQAHMLSYVRGYMKAAKLPQVKKGISKEILAKRGLVSIEDYYLQRHALKFC